MPKLLSGDLHSAPGGKAPGFLVYALKDIYSGNLDRIQIIKGWVDGSGMRWKDQGTRIVLSLSIPLLRESLVL